MRKQTELFGVFAALGAGFAISLSAVPTAEAADDPFAITWLKAGTQLAAEGSCGNHPAGEGGCGGKAPAPATAGAQGSGDDDAASTDEADDEKAGEGRCGS